MLEFIAGKLGGVDKLVHVLVGALIAAYLLPLGLIPAIACTLFAAIGKEAFDYLSGKGSTDAWDVVATVAGGGVSIGWFYLIA